jgi:hypothetical protein
MSARWLLGTVTLWLATLAALPTGTGCGGGDCNSGEFECADNTLMSCQLGELVAVETCGDNQCSPSPAGCFPQGAVGGGSAVGPGSGSTTTTTSGTGAGPTSTTTSGAGGTGGMTSGTGGAGASAGMGGAPGGGGMGGAGGN